MRHQKAKGGGREFSSADRSECSAEFGFGGLERAFHMQLGLCGLVRALEIEDAAAAVHARLAERGTAA